MTEIAQWFIAEPRRIAGALFVFAIIMFILTWSICSIIESAKGNRFHD